MRNQRPYQRPTLTVVELRIDEAILSNCKSSLIGFPAAQIFGVSGCGSLIACRQDGS